MERKREIAKASYEKNRAERIAKVAKRKRRISQERLSSLPSKTRKITPLGKPRKLCSCKKWISPHSGRYDNLCNRCSEIKHEFARWTTDPKIDKEFAKRNRKWWTFLASKGIRHCDKLPWGHSKLANQFNDTYWRHCQLEDFLRKRERPQFEIKRFRIAFIQRRAALKRNRSKSRKDSNRDSIRLMRMAINPSTSRFFQMLAAVGQISAAMNQQTK